TLFNYTGHKFSVETHERVTLTSYWDGGTRYYYAVIRLGMTDSALPVKFGDTPATITRIGECGGMGQPNAPTIEITPDTIIAQHTIFCGKDLGITFMVHPSRL